LRLQVYYKGTDSVPGYLFFIILSSLRSQIATSKISGICHPDEGGISAIWHKCKTANNFYCCNRSNSILHIIGIPPSPGWQKMLRGWQKCLAMIKMLR